MGQLRRIVGTEAHDSLRETRGVPRTRSDPLTAANAKTAQGHPATHASPTPNPDVSLHQELQHQTTTLVNETMKTPILPMPPHHVPTPMGRDPVILDVLATLPEPFESNQAVRFSF